MAATGVQQTLVQQAPEEKGDDERTFAEPYLGVLNEVRAWPEEWRFKLIHALLDTLARQDTTAERRKSSAEKLVGFLAVEGQAPPTDEEVESIIEEASIEKYG